MSSALDSTRRTLLDTARELAQTRGYNAFSFRDLAERIDITTASIHYHFPTKAHLGRDLVISYREEMEAALRQIESRTQDPRERIERLCGMLRNSIKRGTRMCLCGMFGAEHATLPGPVQDEVQLYFHACEKWLATVLKAGRASGRLRFSGDPVRVAEGAFASLQGGMLAACTFQSEARFDAAADRVLASLTQER